VIQRTERPAPGEVREPDPDPNRLVGSDRVLAVLRAVGARPEGATLDELARAVDSPKPTVHRALVALRRAGFAHQDGHGRYSLGDEFLRLAFSNHQARPDYVRVQPFLEELASRFGETVHYGVLEGREIVYRAKVDPSGRAVRLTSTVGGRNPAHSTAIGQVLLSHQLLDLDAVRTWVSQGVLEQRTTRTLTAADDLHARFERIREHGYAVDDEANEPWVSCLAIPVSLQPDPTPTGAISVTALTYRTPLAELVAGLPDFLRIVGPISGRGAA
jgi:IclR family transcriptional regulator, acetate operon repressor